MEYCKAICILATNRTNDEEAKLSRRVCRGISDILAEEEIICRILELKKYEPDPCTGCGRCHDIRRCGRDKDFNRIYEEMLEADYVFFISPCCAPIPAKLCMLLEKIEQIDFLHRWREDSHSQGMKGKLAGIISIDCGKSQGAGSCKAMVNDTIARTLRDVSLKVVPYNSKWDTGICLPMGTDKYETGACPPPRSLEEIEEETRKYVEVIVQTSKSLYAIL